MPAQKIGALLAAPELNALSRKARRLAQLQQLFLHCAPRPLARSSRVVDYRTGTLLLVADNAAVASKLRQLAPRLLSDIRKGEPEVTGIKIAVQVNDVTPEAHGEPQSGKTGIENIEVFRGLALRLPESTLKTALSNLIRRHGRRRPSDRQ